MGSVIDAIFENIDPDSVDALSIPCIVLYLMQQFVHINLLFVQMDAPRLDRLTALLEGLSPKVTLTSKANGFSLNIIKTGTPELSLDSSSATHLDALSLLACPAEHSLSKTLEPDQHCLMSFEVVFDGPMGPGLLAELSQPISINMKDADPSLVQVMTLIANEMSEITPMLLYRTAMKIKIINAPIQAAFTAFLTESAPKVGPTRLSSNCSKAAGNDPALKEVAIILASLIVSSPLLFPPSVMTADPFPISLLITGAVLTTRSRTTATLFRIFSAVIF